MIAGTEVGKHFLSRCCIRWEASGETLGASVNAAATTVWRLLRCGAVPASPDVVASPLITPSFRKNFYSPPTKGEQRCLLDGSVRVRRNCWWQITRRHEDTTNQIAQIGPLANQIWNCFLQPGSQWQKCVPIQANDVSENEEKGSDEQPCTLSLLRLSSA